MCVKSVLPCGLIKTPVARAVGLRVFILVWCANLCRPYSRLGDSLGLQALDCSW